MGELIRFNEQEDETGWALVCSECEEDLTLFVDKPDWDRIVSIGCCVCGYEILLDDGEDDTVN